MRKAYEDVANPIGWNYSNPLIKEVVEVCSQLADAELAEQAANHAKEIFALEKEMVGLKEEIIRLDVDRIIALNI